MSYALLTPDLSAVQIYPVSIQQVREFYPELRNVSISKPDPDLYPRLVEPLDVEPPTTTFGQTLQEGVPERQADGSWVQTWQVIEPSPERVAEVRLELKQNANAVASAKRQELTAAHVLTFMELDRLAADATPTPGEYPLIAAIALGRSDGGTATTFAQAVTGAQNFRANWVARAVQVERKYHEIIGRIDNATTLAEARAILTELEELA